eukprot:SAG22_NODE_4010_length_1424_cov_1.311698_2_plen_101_part_00
MEPGALAAGCSSGHHGPTHQTELLLPYQRMTGHELWMTDPRHYAAAGAYEAAAAEWQAAAAARDPLRVLTNKARAAAEVSCRALTAFRRASATIAFRRLL